VAARELEYVNEHGMRHYNYTALALQYAPLMFDAIHFTYYWVPCAQTFPELARLVAQLGFQHAVGRPVQVCPAGYDAEVTAAERETALYLGQPPHMALAAYKVAAGMAAHSGFKLPKKGGKGKGGGAAAAANPKLGTGAAVMGPKAKAGGAKLGGAKLGGAKAGGAKRAGAGYV